MHGILTYLTVEDFGNFRKGGEGVFDENGNCIFVCPPPEQIDGLMNQLFDWMESIKDEIHPLILSSIFHYEFVFIHPFRDENEPLGQQKTYLQKYLQNKGFTDFGKSFFLNEFYNFSIKC